ncbi:MAG: cysteine desulfurase family protein [Chloroflexi bacterium]|nr:cysteine desulfurase family protein [Chloroflexota bacterium]
MERHLYFDYCATTPIHPEVRSAMLKTLDQDFGNPSSMHSFGKSAAQAIADARAEVAAGLCCSPDEITFTSGATESDNLALLGVMRQQPPGKTHLITTSIEHHAVLHTAKQLQSEGYQITVLSVDDQGLVDPADVRKALRPDTALISVMLVNNEVGSIQPVAEIGKIAHENGILFHSDAVQAIGLLDVNVQTQNIDLLSLSAHKIYGPKGVGALFVRKGVSLAPLSFGGSQENSLRPGTENVPGIAGLGAAMRLTNQHKAVERERLSRLRSSLISGLLERIPGLTVNGPAAQAAHVLSLSFPDANGEMMLIRLNGAGIAVSMGSACTSKDIEPSHVLTAMRMPLSQIDGTLRISLGYPTTEAELLTLLEILPEIWRKAKNN